MTFEQAKDILERLGDGWRIEAYLKNGVLEFTFYCWDSFDENWMMELAGDLESIEEEVKEIERNGGES